MANLKQIRKHIANVQNTAKITKAMKMVAVSKLRSSQDAVVSTRPYVSGLIKVIEHLILQADAADHPLLRKPKIKKNCVLIVMSADKGLCGAYNHNIVKATRNFVEKQKENFDSIKIIFAGTKAKDALRTLKHVEMTSIPNAWDKPPSELALQLAEQLSEDYLNIKIDAAYILYTQFKSVIAQNVVLDAVLPLQSILENDDDHDPETQKDISHITPVSYLYEPSPEKILEILLPRAVSIHIQRGLLEALASEHGARMTAMDNATNNATDMIAELQLRYNGARQSAITTELIEVVSGAEAL